MIEILPKRLLDAIVSQYKCFFFLPIAMTNIVSTRK